MAHVLIIDDESDSRELVSLVLADAGYIVSEAGNGRQGLDLLARVRCDLVLLDLQMPVMSGTEFVEELQRQGEAHAFGVIAMSGRVDARSSPAKWFLPKPLDLTLLLAVVGDFCGRRETSSLWVTKQHRESLAAIAEALRATAAGGRR